MNKEEEKIYNFNEYVLGYDKGRNDKSCLTISKIQNGNMYVMSSLYDESAEIISTILDNFQQELDKYKNIIDELENRMLLKINRHYNEKQYVVCIADLEELYDKLKKLKGE